MDAWCHPLVAVVEFHAALIDVPMDLESELEEEEVVEEVVVELEEEFVE